MLIAALLLAAHPADAPPGHAGEAPVELIDFLGRRRECAERDSAAASAPSEMWYFYGCPGIAREEAAHRARFAGDANALAWLDEAPEDFDLQWVRGNLYHGPPAADVRRSEQSGRTRRGPWRVTLDMDAHPRAAALTLAFPDGPNRTLWLEHGLFPWLDPASLAVAMDPERTDRPPYLLVDLRYGFHRGWCGDIDPDDRPDVSIVVTAPRADIMVNRGDRTNCQQRSDEVAPARFLAPPR